MLRELRAKFLPALVVLVVAAAELRAEEAVRADDQDRGLERAAAARALFAEGLAHADAQRWPEAADRFQRAHHLRPTPEIGYNLSTALIRTGRLVRASEILRQITADPRANAAVKQAASTRLDDLLPRLAYLTVAINRPTSATVFVDDEPIGAARLGVALPVDPAEHAVELRQRTARGFEVAGRQVVTLREGERRAVALEPPPAPRVPAPATYARAAMLQPRAGAPAADVASTAPRAGKGWVWLLVGAVAAGLTAGVIIAARDRPAEPMGNVDTWRLGQ